MTDLRETSSQLTSDQPAPTREQTYAATAVAETAPMGATVPVGATVPMAPAAMAPMPMSAANAATASMPMAAAPAATASMPMASPVAALAHMPAPTPMPAPAPAPAIKGAIVNEHGCSYEYATFPRRFLSYRWFKPLLVAGLAIFFIFVLQIVLVIVASVWAGDPNFIDTIGTGYEDMNPYTGPGAIVELGAIAVMIPALAIAALIVRDRPFSSYSSSRGGWNWATFAKCIGVGVVVYAISIAVETIFFPGDSAAGDGVIRFTVAGAILCAVLIPLQSAAEEFVFRGFIMQTVGAWTKLPAVAIIVSAAVFAAGHPYNLIGVVTIFFNGIIWGVVAWKTRGLEATTAVHVVNNLIAFTSSGLGLEASTSEIAIESLIAAIAIDVVYAVVVIALGKKFGWFEPKGDGTVDHNARVAAKRAQKQQRQQQCRGISQPPAPPAAAGWQTATPMAPAGWQAPAAPAAWQTPIPQTSAAWQTATSQMPAGQQMPDPPAAVSQLASAPPTAAAWQPTALQASTLRRSPSA